MYDELNFDEIINKYRSDPFDYVDVHTAHTGRIKFHIEENSEVVGPSGQWRHRPGTLLYEITREKNLKNVNSMTNGTVSSLREELDGEFVEAGEKLFTIKHPLKKKEIIENILQGVLSLFRAPERAKYFFALDIQARIDKQDDRKVTVTPGDEIMTMSLMKRDTPVFYAGEPGIIHSVYFQPGVTIEQGEPLIGICAPEKLPLIQKIITHVKAEWD